MAVSERKRRPRDRQATREAILAAARTRMAEDGPEGLSLSEVAALAGVNRGTAYQHFETREKLVRATTDWVSEQLYRAVFGDPAQAGSRAVEEVDIADLTDHMTGFAMANPELCRVWLLQLLASPDPASDLFFREYRGLFDRFAASDDAEPGIDTEAMTVLFLAGTFLWPVWARSHREGDQAALAQRFSNECLRLSMFGSLRTERYPEIAGRLRRRRGGPETGAPRFPAADRPHGSPSE